MSSINKVILVGNLGQDPELRWTPDGTAVTTLSIATSDKYKDKQTGQQQEVTEWHRVVLFGRIAEIANEYATKGSKVYIEGKIKTRKWQDQQGADRYTTEVVVSVGGQFQMLSSNQAGGATSQVAPASRAPQKITQPNRPDPQRQQAPAPELDDFSDDIPF